MLIIWGLRLGHTSRSKADEKIFLKELRLGGLSYFDVKAASESLEIGSYKRLPYSARVFAENVVRNCGESDSSRYLDQIIGRKKEIDFPWFPARVVCHDILADRPCRFSGFARCHS